MPPANAPRSWRRRLLFCATGIVVVLLVLELTVHLGARWMQRERGLRFDPDLGWRMVANLTRVGRHWSASRPTTTNSRGWRDRERELAKPPGTKRLVAIGDSFTFGVGVDQDQRFTELLEQRLPEWQAINLGVNAYGTVQQLRVLELEGLLYQPDAVVLQVFSGNDLDDIRTRRRFGLPSPWCDLRNDQLEFVPAEADWCHKLRSWSYLAEIGFGQLDRWMPSSEAAPPWVHADTLPLFLALVGRMRSLCAEKGIRFLVIVAIGAEQHDRMVAGLQALPVDTIDLRTPFARVSKDGADLIVDGHWNLKGHGIVADEIIAWLRR